MTGNVEDAPGNPVDTTGLPDDYEGHSSRPEPPSSATSEPLQPVTQPKYAQVPSMRAHDAIPPHSQAARAAAVSRYETIRKASPELVSKFENYFHAWKATWHTSAPLSSSAADRCDVPEFDNLLDMGKEITPLVIYMLLPSENFTAVYLYNALEDDMNYRIDPHDVLNFLVLQRQQNLIIDINRDREW